MNLRAEPRCPAAWHTREAPGGWYGASRGGVAGIERPLQDAPGKPEGRELAVGEVVVLEVAEMGDRGQ